MRPRAAPLVLVTLPLACGGGEGARELRSAVLITLDTTRADALGCYGRADSPTPSLDRLARESVVQEGAHTVAPLTLPAHASMMTGLYPPRHTVRDNGMSPVPRSAVTLAERARAAGVQTAAVVAAAVLDHAFGLDQGFDSYDDPAHRGFEGSERRASEVADRALAWLAGRDRERPFFLWVHLFDPHAPYDPPDAFRSAPGAGVPYLGEVAAMDGAIGRLVERLREDELLDELTLMVVADHGEAFGEHEEYSHGAYCYEPTLRVPMLLRHPGGRGGGGRSARVTSVVDVHPTLAEAMGLPPERSAPALDGESLFGREAAPERGVYFESYNGFLYYGWSPIAGWLDARGKYLHSSEPQLFDPWSDPGEAADLVVERASELDGYRAAIERLTRRPALSREQAHVAQDLLVDVQNLGYAGAGDAPEDDLPHPLAESDLPAPARTAAVHRKLMEATVHRNAGDPQGACALLEEVLAADPANYYARETLGSTLIEAQRCADAIPVFEALLRDGRRGPSTYYLLAVALMRVEREAEAVDALVSSHELAPGNAAVLEALAGLLEREGRADEAATYRARLRALPGGR